VKVRRPLLISFLLSAAAFAGCTAGDQENAAPAPEATTADPTETETAAEEEAGTAAEVEAEASTETVAPSSQPSRHWLAPPPAPAEAAVAPQAWADYKYTEWLHGMNTTYREMCGELTDLSVYRACVLDDPHAYITDFSATEIGELIITIGPGPWENGTYETESIPAELFVSGNVPFHIAKFATDFDSVTVVTPDGDSHTQPYDPILDHYFDHVALEDLIAG
jgi:hypothetical protein